MVGKEIPPKIHVMAGWDLKAAAWGHAATAEVPVAVAWDRATAAWDRGAMEGAHVARAWGLAVKKEDLETGILIQTGGRIVPLNPESPRKGG